MTQSEQTHDSAAMSASESRVEHRFRRTVSIGSVNRWQRCSVRLTHQVDMAETRNTTNFNRFIFIVLLLRKTYRVGGILRNGRTVPRLRGTSVSAPPDGSIRSIHASDRSIYVER